MWMQINQAFIPLYGVWSSLAQREKSLLLFLVLFLGGVLFYLLVWSPIEQANTQAKQKLSQAQQEWHWLNQQVPTVLEQRTSISPQAPQNQNVLLSLLQKSLRQKNLFKDIQTLQGIDSGAKVVFTKVDAARLFSWLALLEQQGLVAGKLKMVWLEPGLVKADIGFSVLQSESLR